MGYNYFLLPFRGNRTVTFSVLLVLTLTNYLSYLSSDKPRAVIWPQTRLQPEHLWDGYGLWGFSSFPTEECSPSLNSGCTDLCFNGSLTVFTATYSFMTVLERPRISASTIVELCCVWDCRSNFICIQNIRAYHDLPCLYLELMLILFIFKAVMSLKWSASMKHRHTGVQWSVHPPLDIHVRQVLPGWGKGTEVLPI